MRAPCGLQPGFSWRCRNLPLLCRPARALSSPISTGGIPRQNCRRFSGHRSKWPLNELKERSAKGPPLIFRSESTNPYHNLSLEDYLLRHSDHSSKILLFYVNRPCVVIGRNQNPWMECNLREIQRGLLAQSERHRREGQPRGDTFRAALSGGSNGETCSIDLVRRRSGGGTVFHDYGNLNYSVIVPNDKAFNRRKHAEMVVQGLDTSGVKFEAAIKVNERHDIVMRKHSNPNNEWLKVSGSAFKLTKGRALHHGTLLVSSPNLRGLPNLLRSPGRDFIRAKGVESVRSKVGNLYWTTDDEEQKRVQHSILDSIAKSFQQLYGAVDDFIELSDSDCLSGSNPAVAQGVAELRDNAWKFEQTPRFDFHSGWLNDHELSLSVNKGILGAISIEKATGEHLIASLSQDTRLRIYEVGKWVTTLTQFSKENEDEAFNGQLRKVLACRGLVDRLEATFPAVPGLTAH